ncbi:MAG: hypothetical protein AABY07_01745 [Nanoarchaeota archaeon]
MTGCSITNLGTCLVEKFFEYLLYIFNLPIQVMLSGIQNLMTSPVSTSPFLGVWTIIVYILSMFYGLFLVFVGIKFIVSGHAVEQREKAKSNLRDIFLMIVFVQASYLLYGLILEVSSALTITIFNFIPSDFFLLTANSLGNLGLELVFMSLYLLVLVLMLIILVLRYMFVSFGVVLFAIGLFFYFLDSVSDYGKLILNYLFVAILMPFIYALILLAGSKFLEVSIFSEMKILVMIGTFALINVLTFIIVIFVIIKATLKVSTPVTKVARIVV